MVIHVYPFVGTQFIIPRVWQQLQVPQLLNTRKHIKKDKQELDGHWMDLDGP